MVVLGVYTSDQGPPQTKLSMENVGDRRIEGSVALIDRRTRFTGLVSGFGSDHSGELIECGRET